MPCHICKVKREEVTCLSVASKWCWEKVVTILPNNSLPTDITKSRTRHSKEKSTLLVDPMLFKFSFMGVHSGVDLYSIFRFGPFYNLSLGISRLLEKCIRNMLLKEGRGTSALKPNSKSNKTFKATELVVLFTLNLFLTDCQKRFMDLCFSWIPKI